LLDCLSTMVEHSLLFDCICCELNTGDWGLLVCLSTGSGVDHCLLGLNCLIICCQLSTDLLRTGYFLATSKLSSLWLSRSRAVISYL
jgi:hypothetical protein